MKKIIALLICAVLCLSLFAACSKDDAGTGADTGAGTGTGTGTGAGTGTPSSPSVGSQTTPTPGSGTDITQPDAAPEDTTEVVFADHMEYIFADAVGMINLYNAGGGGSTHTNTCLMIYDGLFYNLPDGTSLPSLCTSYETDDYQTWIFHIRDDVKFHNGYKLTAEDVVYSWQRGKAAIGSQANNNWFQIEEGRVIDDYTVEFKTARPYGNLLFNLGTPYTSIVCKKAIEEDADDVTGYYIGSGAYKIADFSPSNYIMFERNDDYWGEIPYTKTQTWRMVTEQSARTIMLQTGAAQLGGIGAIDMDLFLNDPNFKIMQAISNNSMSIQFNMNNRITGDLNFRLAVAYAVDIEEITLFAAGEVGVPVTDGTIWGYQVPYKNTNIPRIVRDLDKAKAYLADSIYNGEEIEYTIMSGGQNEDAAVALQDELKLVGINIRINPMDVPSFIAYTSQPNDYTQMFTWFAGGSQNPVDTYRGFYPGTNMMGYDNPVITEMFDQSPSILEEAAKREHYFKMQEIVTADRPCIPLFWMQSMFAYPANAGGFVVNASADNDLRYWYQIIDG